MPRRLLLVVVLALSAACASSPEKRQRIVAEQSARLRPPTVALTTFGTFEVLPVAMSPAVAEKAEKATMATQLGERLNARLQPLLASWQASAPADARARTLQIQATVVSLRVVGGAARFWGGALAGDSHIEMDLSLVEKQTGSEIARERIRQSAGAMAGAWSIGSTDKNLSEYVVDIAHQYLANNHP